MPGVKGSLLDKQGFPRSDIDVAAVRRDRHRLICLTNDHRALSDRLAGLLAELHAAMRSQAAEAGPSQAAAPAATNAASVPMEVDGGASTSTTTSTTTSSTSGAPATRVGPAATAAAAAAAPAAPPGPSGPALVPFALVDEVTDGSPASAAGLQVGDLLCSFGEVSGAGEDGASPSGSSTAALLQRVAGVLGASEGRAVAATVLRQGAPVAVSLTPQRWSGRGLLGCHLKPL
ncbi:hypothetical protein HXX76_012349 [Chlamydomonas incerta]|uniref:Nas2 N-terminal domain-containing protein n=1 Tax=Chlamydomonas incerta TaxID=51695 RepID=A0A835SPM2_CHLIN|nr:hypothetical protein HXX76_012349 [Chlamydomonas incerta]|eukprot:KAG2427413.1 hypothetical protein HXX76_012349 [Chlamydomonas incerta]